MKKIWIIGIPIIFVIILLGSLLFPWKCVEAGKKVSPLEKCCEGSIKIISTNQNYCVKENPIPLEDCVGAGEKGDSEKQQEECCENLMGITRGKSHVWSDYSFYCVYP
jgi:hypothetical protein